MQLEESITGWLQHLKRGDAEAAERLWQHFFGRACALARGRIPASIQRECDAEDVALSAMRALCIGIQEGRFPDLANRTELWRLLATITFRKASNAMRRTLARPEVGESAVPCASDAPQPLQELSDERVLESWSAICDEMLERLDPKLRDVALLRLQGYTNGEIASLRGCSIKTIERYLSMIRLEWSA